MCNCPLVPSHLARRRWRRRFSPSHRSHRLPGHQSTHPSRNGGVPYSHSATAEYVRRQPGEPDSIKMGLAVRNSHSYLHFLLVYLLVSVMFPPTSSSDNHYLSLLLPAFKKHASRPVFKPLLTPDFSWGTVTFRQWSQYLEAARLHWSCTLQQMNSSKQSPGFI